MTIQKSEYVWGIDYEALANDVDKRLAEYQITHKELDELLGASISSGLIGDKRKYGSTANMLVHNYCKLCTLLELDARHYFGAFKPDELPYE